MSHTKEPWAHDGHGCVAATGSDQFNNGFFTAECSGPDRIENARRVAACVTACAGLSTENLEQNKPIIEGLRTLNKHRKELLEALEKAAALIRHIAEDSDGDYEDAEEFEAVIAAVKGHNAAVQRAAGGGSAGTDC